VIKKIITITKSAPNIEASLYVRAISVTGLKKKRAT